MQFGSHVYGTSLPTSDTDYKGVHIPDKSDILLQRVRPSINEKTKTDPNAKNTADDVDFESFSLQQFMKLLLEGQTIALDMLFTPERWILQSSPTWREIVDRKDQWLSRSVTAFVGYCRQQAAKYGVRGSRVAAVRAVLKLLDEIIAFRGNSPTNRLEQHWHGLIQFVVDHRDHAQIVRVSDKNGLKHVYLEVCGRKVDQHMTLKHAREVYQRVFDAYGQRSLAAERNEGVDWKAVAHAVRVTTEAEELLLTGHITFHRPDAPLLLRIRKGEVPYKEVAELIEGGIDRVEACVAKSSLRETPNYGAAECLVLEEYEAEVLG